MSLAVTEKQCNLAQQYSCAWDETKIELPCRHVEPAGCLIYRWNDTRCNSDRYCYWDSTKLSGAGECTPVTYRTSCAESQTEKECLAAASNAYSCSWNASATGSVCRDIPDGICKDFAWSRTDCDGSTNCEWVVTSDICQEVPTPSSCSVAANEKQCNKLTASCRWTGTSCQTYSPDYCGLIYSATGCNRDPLCTYDVKNQVCVDYTIRSECSTAVSEEECITTTSASTCEWRNNQCSIEGETEPVAEKDNDDDDKLSGGALAGLVVGVVIGVLVIIALVVVIIVLVIVKVKMGKEDEYPKEETLDADFYNSTFNIVDYKPKPKVDEVYEVKAGEDSEKSTSETVWVV